MLFRHLGTSHRVSLKPTFVDQLCREEPRITLKGASRTRKFERLFFRSFSEKLITFGFYLLGISLSQSKICGKYYPLGVLQLGRMAV